MQGKVRGELLTGVGSHITFLKKKLICTDDGILVAPGIPIQRIVETFEEAFGPARAQVLPCDGAIQLEDSSQLLSVTDATKFRSVVGMALYLGRDRPDAMFAIKELAGKMSRPTLSSLQHLRKLVGYLKNTGDLGTSLFPRLLAKGNGRLQQKSSGFWKHSLMLIGWETGHIGRVLRAESIC